MKRDIKVISGAVVLLAISGFVTNAFAIPEYYPTTGRTINVPDPSGLVYRDDGFWVLSWSLADGRRLHHYSSAPGTWGLPLHPDGGYSVPEHIQVQGLAWDGTYWWIVDNTYGGDHIDKCTLDGTGLNIVQSYPWPTSGPVSAEWAEGYLWIADNHSDTIFRATVGDTSFTSIEPWSTANMAPYGLAWDGTHIWSLCSPSGGGASGPREIYKHDADGNIIEIWHYPGADGPPPGAYGGCGQGLAIADQHLYYSDPDKDQIVELVIEPPVIEATVDIDPDTLNLKSKGKWITCYIELPEGYDVADIDVSTVVLNDLVPAESRPTGILDHDGDGVLELMVKFSRSGVQGILGTADQAELTVTGELADGTPFEGTDTIRVVR